MLLDSLLLFLLGLEPHGCRVSCVLSMLEALGANPDKAAINPDQCTPVHRQKRRGPLILPVLTPNQGRFISPSNMYSKSFSIEGTQ